MGGILFFLLRPTSFVTSADTSKDAKTRSSSPRVINPVAATDSKTTSDSDGYQATPTQAIELGSIPPVKTPSSNTPVSSPPTTPTNPPSKLDATSKQTLVAPAGKQSVVPEVDLNDDPAPHPFNAKALPTSTKVVFDRRRVVSTASLAPPTIIGGSVSNDFSSLPVSLNPPPPPAPAVAVKAPDSGPQSIESAQASAVRVGGSFTQPVLVRSVPPVYPPAAVERKQQGVVRFQATIAKDGSVKDLQLVTGDPLLNVAARQAVMQWKYKPAVLNGKEIEVTQAIVVKFNLNR